jgi:DNA repair exonuclease SbcCD ATPase subunit
MKPWAFPLMMLSSVIGGCAAWTAATPLQQPYFTVDSAEAKTFQALAKKQEQLAAKCHEANSCDHVYFTRALLGLYESREVAEKYFGKVLGVAPKSHLAYSSKAWIQLLQEHGPPGTRSWPQAVLTASSVAEANASLGHTMDRLVRDLLDREVVIQQLRTTKDGDSQTVESLQRELADRERKIEALTSKKDGTKLVPEPAAIQNLQKQLAERDKKIEELSTQLEALKRIDQEMREKVRPIRPPTGASPAPTPEATQ